MKKLKIALLCVLIAVAGGTWWFMNSFESIVKRAVHKYGSEITGTDVSISGFDLSLKSGEGTVRGFAIANPKGYASPNLLSLKEITVAVDLASLAYDTIVIKKIKAVNPAISYEIQSLNHSNLSDILDNIKKNTASAKPNEKKAESDSGGKKLIIEDLDIVDGQIGSVLSVAGASSEVSAKLPEIRIRDIGKEKKGTSVAEAFVKVLDQLFTVATTTAVSAKLGDLEQVAKKQLDNVVGSVKDRIGDTGIFNFGK